MVPDPPALPVGTRLAGTGDIWRLAIVCTAGFRYSEQFIWERPKHEQHPLSTIIAFCHEVKQFIQSPEHIVLVSLDSYDPEESKRTKAVIPSNTGWVPPPPGYETIVSLTVWKLEPGSQRLGEFRGPQGPIPSLPDYDGADLDITRAEKVIEVAAAAEHKYLTGLFTMERTVTHPAYWRRGHAGKLTRWGLALSQLDGIDQGVLATTMGATFFQFVGFKQLAVAHVDGDDQDPAGFDLAVLKYLVSRESRQEAKICIMF